MDRASFQLNYQVCPIMLTHGLAENVEGGMLPIISLTNPDNFSGGLLSNAGDLGLDDFFAQYIPLDASLADQDAALYPYANQSVAANAVIENPLAVSLRMICPVRESGGYSLLLATMTNLQAQLTKHNLSGGTYTIATPSFIFTDCLLKLLKQTSAGPAQAQSEWRWDFIQPLLTLSQAVQSQNNLMNKITAATAFKSQPAWSGGEPTVGLPPSLATGVTVPAAQSPSGSNAAAPFGFSPGTGSLQQ